MIRNPYEGLGQWLMGLGDMYRQHKLDQRNEELRQEQLTSSRERRKLDLEQFAVNKAVAESGMLSEKQKRDFEAEKHPVTMEGLRGGERRAQGTYERQGKEHEDALLTSDVHRRSLLSGIDHHRRLEGFREREIGIQGRQADAQIAALARQEQVLTQQLVLAIKYGDKDAAAKLDLALEQVRQEKQQTLLLKAQTEYWEKGGPNHDTDFLADIIRQQREGGGGPRAVPQPTYLPPDIDSRLLIKKPGG